MFDEIVQVLPPVLMSLPVFGALGTLLFFSRKEFRANWRGHEIVVRNHITKEELYIDGRLEAVTRKGQRGEFHAMLAGAIRHGSERIPVLVSLDSAFTVQAEVFVDGTNVPVSAKRMAVRGASTTPAPQAPAEDFTQDGRWRAARTILAAIRASKSCADASLMALCDRVETQLLLALKKLGAIDATKIAHVTLASASEATADLDTIRAELEAEIARLLAGIQRLHIVTLRDATEADLAGVRELLVAITTETELGSLSESGSTRRAAVQKSIG